ncbi:hypothetical protein WJX72_000931 [[Myrmecia] bisecta]|uniref:F-box domain-containing protein n=1 Tax=[Myrmecia] bisecta TaxID=41462 RepID=A0AAW1PT20_9CHLO
MIQRQTLPADMEAHVQQAVAQFGPRGVWSADMAATVEVSQPQLRRLLRNQEQRGLVRRSRLAKGSANRKVYIGCLFDRVPEDILVTIFGQLSSEERLCTVPLLRKLDLRTKRRGEYFASDHPMVEDMENTLKDLSLLRQLTSLTYQAEGPIEVTMPAACELFLKVPEGFGQIPTSLVGHLVILEITFSPIYRTDGKYGDTILYLRKLQVCHCLRELILVEDIRGVMHELRGPDRRQRDDPYVWTLKWEVLPASLATVTVIGSCQPSFPSEAVESYAGGVFQVLHGVDLKARQQVDSDPFQFPSTIMDQGVLTSLQHLPENLAELRLTVHNVQLLNSGPTFPLLRTLELCLDDDVPEFGYDPEPLNVHKFSALEELVLRPCVFHEAQAALVSTIVRDLH